uniref:NADH dehydrogenase subunit 1 n=1 Tax=Dipterophagus daci TaxID=2800156 RepID=UPI001D112CB8|nr:NADH dehydrogenase subunit 1 [Dipterophagus daci]QZO77424.1 NADH dehydrogenase subunit 1 [Dipterophagus daci]
MIFFLLDLMLLLNYMIYVLFFFISIMFLTMMERKILGLMQIRKSVNKVGVLGVIQPFSDMLKLFFKEFFLLIYFNFFLYLFIPFFSLFIVMLMFMVLPFENMNLIFDFSILFMVCCLMMNTYFIILMSWSCNSKYSYLSSVRSVAQMISYEVSFFIFLLCIIILIISMSLVDFLKNQKYLWFLFILINIFFIFLLVILSELNRIPFDFLEGESELVSGFNIEFGSGIFGLIFLVEYLNILFFSVVLMILFMGGNFYELFMWIKLIIFMFIVLLLRGVFPRFRYDKLMMMSWKMFLPISLNMLMYLLMLDYYMC